MFSAAKIAAPSGGGYNLTRSLRFRASASAYLSRTPATTSNQKTWTWSAWVKRGASASRMGLFTAGINGTAYWTLEFDANNSLTVYDYSAAGALTTTPLYRDPSAWYHIVLAEDTTQATASNRTKIYVNGVQVTSFSAPNYIPQNTNTYVNTGSISHNIGSETALGVTNYFDGYMTEVNFIDGQALTPSSFGSTNSTTGVWQPAAYTGTYGTNGFYLPFTDNSALTTSSNVGLGKDFSGNGNYWATNNISITAGVTYDSMTDVPTLTSATAANFAVLNPLIPQSSQSLSNGNLCINSSGSSVSDYLVPANIGMTSGKYYCEFTITTAPGQNLVGITTNPMTTTNFYNQYSGSTEWVYVSSGSKSTNNTTTAYGASWAAGDVIGIALDASAGTLTFYKNGTSQGAAFTSLSGTFFFFWASSTSGASTVYANFGQTPFTYTPPSGFVALNTYNLPDSTIKQGNKVMDATLYTGTLLSNSIVNAAAFKPDLVWLKSRSAATNNELTDSVRGVTKALVSNSTAAEATDVQGLTALNSNGFTVGTNTDYNNLAATYVAWQWQAGQGSSSSNTNGTITSTVSVNASAGFSVVTYTTPASGSFTVGHGLGVAPSLIIPKCRNFVLGWPCYHASLGNTQYINLDLTSAAGTSSSAWNNTSPSSSIITFGSTGFWGVSATYVAYCWTPIAGFSAFGSISANGAADNYFAYTGFLSRFVMLKRTDSTSNWIIWDTARNTFNVLGNELYANLSNAEASAVDIDILSNGFKLRSSSFSGTWIYAAFASNPFKNSLAF